MKSCLVAMALAPLLCCSCGVAPAAALDRRDLLRVVGTVHSDERVAVVGSEHTPRGKDCRREFTRDIQPVCASNGRKYTNESMFYYKQCLIKEQEGTEITLVDMAFCKDVEEEDMENVDSQ